MATSFIEKLRNMLRPARPDNTGGAIYFQEEDYLADRREKEYEEYVERVKSEQAEVAVVGVTFENCQETLAELYYSGDSFTGSLVRQPNNIHDPNAIAVHINGKQVGFIARRLAAELAHEIDAGQDYEVVQVRICPMDTWISNKHKPSFGARVILQEVS